jgi:hypothetical protein
MPCGCAGDSVSVPAEHPRHRRDRSALRVDGRQGRGGGLVQAAVGTLVAHTALALSSSGRRGDGGLPWVP